MKAALMAVAMLGGLACAPVVVEVKPRTIVVDQNTTVGSAADCQRGVFPASAIELEAMLKDAGLDLSQGCLQKLSFGLLAGLGLSGATGCASPRGTGTLSSLGVELACADGSTRALSVSCPSTALDFTDVAATADTLNRCLDRAETELAEPVRKAANECRPKRLTVTPVGSCSADACFQAHLSLGFRLDSATAQLGGTCP